MEIINNCPECGKQLSKSISRCSCGWKIPVVKELKVTERRCKHILPEGPCNRVGSIAPHGCGGKWYCGTHWYEAFRTEYYKR